MRQTAKILLVTDEVWRPPCPLYLDSFGDPRNVREMVRRALRGRRRDVRDDQQAVFFRVIREAMRYTELQYQVPSVFGTTWEYVINMSSNSDHPIVTIKGPDTKERISLFKWIGSQKTKHIPPAPEKPKLKLIIRRGRPSSLRHLQVPLPERFKQKKDDGSGD
jgi:hypothetical protein